MHDDYSLTGPVEWVALTFPGATLDARVVTPIKDLVDARTVRLLDAAVLHKDVDGVVAGGELEGEDLAAFDEVEGEVLELLSDEDLRRIGAGTQPGTTTLVLAWENRWASAFAATVRRAGGTVTASERVPADVARAALLDRSATAGVPS